MWQKTPEIVMANDYWYNLGEENLRKSKKRNFPPPALPKKAFRVLPTSLFQLKVVFLPLRAAAGDIEKSWFKKMSSQQYMSKIMMLNEKTTAYL